MPSQQANMPVKDALINKDGTIVEVWRVWLRGMRDMVTAAPERVYRKALLAQSAAIGTVSMPVTLTTGLWRVSWSARITTPATTSSSLTVTIGWTDSGVALTSSGAAMTGNLTTTVQSGSLLLAADGNTPLTYATAYASVGATAMVYKLDIVVERVSA